MSSYKSSMPFSDLRNWLLYIQQEKRYRQMYRRFACASREGKDSTLENEAKISCHNACRCIRYCGGKYLQSKWIWARTHKWWTVRLKRGTCYAYWREELRWRQGNPMLSMFVSSYEYVLGQKQAQDIVCVFSWWDDHERDNTIGSFTNQNFMNSIQGGANIYAGFQLDSTFYILITFQNL